MSPTSFNSFQSEQAFSIISYCIINRAYIYVLCKNHLNLFVIPNQKLNEKEQYHAKDNDRPHNSDKRNT
jgi:hypothetical protein